MTVTPATDEPEHVPPGTILFLALARTLLFAALFSVVPIALLRFDGGTAFDPFALDGSSSWGLQPAYATLLFFMLGLAAFPAAFVECRAARLPHGSPLATTALATVASSVAFALLVVQFGYTSAVLEHGSFEVAARSMGSWLRDVLRTWDAIALRATALVVPLALTTRLRLSRLRLERQTALAALAAFAITGALTAVPRDTGEPSRARWAILATGCATFLSLAAAWLDSFAPRPRLRPASPSE